MTAVPPIFHWFMPASGDGRNPLDLVPSAMSTDRGPRSSIRYLSQVAHAADDLGFEGILAPIGTESDEPWIVAAGLARETTRLKFLVAVRPAAITPTLVAQMSTTFQRLSDGRLGLQVVTGSGGLEAQRFGDWSDRAVRYRRTDEFLTVLRGSWEGGFDFAGEYFQVKDARVHSAPEPLPPIYFGGASPEAEEVAAAHADVYLAWGEPPDMLAERIARMRTLAERHERQLRFGIRLQIITRDSADEAWAETDRMLEAMPDAVVRFAQRRMRAEDSVGQQRLNRLHAGVKRDLVIAPNLWAGIGLIRGAGSTALVGSHEEVAARIRELQEIGFEEFILSGLPHLEEAYRFAHGVMPLFADQPDRTSAPAIPGLAL